MSPLSIRGRKEAKSLAGEWPNAALDVSALVLGGWRPRAFNQFVVKVHSRCNLACDYCYVYRSADQTWRDRPVRMSEATVVATADRIAEHVRDYELAGVEVVIHGGEPLLAGTELIAFLATSVRSALPTEVRLDLSIQTNGTLLSDPVLDLFDRCGIKVGVSLDGDAVTHDARRPHHGGHGSHSSVARGLDLLRSAGRRHLYGGLLCVIDIARDPVATYEALLVHEPPMLDLLLPHANRSDSPHRGSSGSAAPHGDWLIAVFERWYAAERRETSIRLFDEIIRMILGQHSRIETVGLSPARLVVVETDGAIEHVDALKSAYEGAASTGLDVRHHPFADALMHPQTVARQIGAGALSATCRRCDIHTVCGGGFYAHRYQRGSGFLNPSVYCGDLSALIRHIHSRVKEDMDRLGRSRLT